MPREKVRCGWCQGDDAYVRYHDEEWGVPVRDDRLLFEFLILEGAQAGLSWLTILKRRDNYRNAFAGFDPGAVARFGDKDRKRLLADAGIIRNRLKIEAAITNAKLFLETAAKHGTFADFMWRYVDGRPIVNKWESLEQIPATSPVSDAIAKDMKKMGFKFVGSTIIYAHMQATGMVNDHLVSCFRHRQVHRHGK